jgi:hypothetical protein
VAQGPVEARVFDQAVNPHGRRLLVQEHGPERVVGDWARPSIDVAM